MVGTVWNKCSPKSWRTPCTFALFVQKALTKMMQLLFGVVSCKMFPFEKSSKIEVLILLILQRVNFVYISHASLCNQLRELYFSCVDFPQLFNIYWIKDSTHVTNCIKTMQSVHIYLRSNYFCKTSYFLVLFLSTLKVWTNSQNMMHMLFVRVRNGSLYAGSVIINRWFILHTLPIWRVPYICLSLFMYIPRENTPSMRSSFLHLV